MQLHLLLISKNVLMLLAASGAGVALGAGYADMRCKAAREDGLGKIFMNKTGFKETAVSTLLLILILILIQALSSRYALGNQHVFYAILFGVLYSFCRISVYFFNKKFGGLTGDTLGAISELTEIAFLFMVIIWSRLSI